MGIRKILLQAIIVRFRIMIAKLFRGTWALDQILIGLQFLELGVMCSYTFLENTGLKFLTTGQT